MITTGFEIFNLIYAANISLKHITDIHVNICINIEIFQSNNTMISKLQNKIQTENYKTILQFLLTCN